MYGLTVEDAYRSVPPLVGVLTWVAYCYLHLAVAAPFNAMFLVSVGALAMAAFGALDGLLRVDVAAVAPAFTAAPRRATAWFLAVSGSGIAGLCPAPAPWPRGRPGGVRGAARDAPRPGLAPDGHGAGRLVAPGLVAGLRLKGRST